jgi:predicted RNase H-like HicB family nuclease
LWQAEGEMSHAAEQRHQHGQPSRVRIVTFIGFGVVFGNMDLVCTALPSYNPKKLMVNFMKLKVVIHPAEEGRFWAEVPAISGCATQGETMEELLTNLYEAVEACLSVDLEKNEIAENDKVLELAM